jgi:hypothetical protein
MRSEQPWVQSNAADPLGSEPRILAGGHAVSVTATTGEQEFAKPLVGGF